MSQWNNKVSTSVDLTPFRKRFSTGGEEKNKGKEKGKSKGIRQRWREATASKFPHTTRSAVGGSGTGTGKIVNKTREKGSEDTGSVVLLIRRKSATHNPICNPLSTFLSAPGRPGRARGAGHMTKLGGGVASPRVARPASLGHFDVSWRVIFPLFYRVLSYSTPVRLVSRIDRPGSTTADRQCWPLRPPVSLPRRDRG